MSTSTTARWADERERRVAVALPVLVELLGRAMVVLEGAVEHRVADRLDHVDAVVPHRVDDLGALDHEPQRIDAEPLADGVEHVLAHGAAGCVDRSPAHPCLARCRCRAGRADAGVDAVELDAVDPEDRPGDLARRS